MAESDADYYARRAVEEMSAAQEARDPTSADIHRELAAKYEALAQSERAGLRPKLGVNFEAGR